MSLSPSDLSSRTLAIFFVVLGVITWLVVRGSIGGGEFITGLIGALGFYAGKNHADKRLKAGTK